MLRTVVALLVALLVTGTLAAVAPAPADATSPAVEDAQRRLHQLGCDPGRVDGSMDGHTRAAILRFQSRHRLPRSGRLTAATVRRLDDDRAHRCDQRPVPPRTGTGRRIVISQRQDWVWLVGAGGKVVGQSGMVDNPHVLHPGWKRVGSYCGRTAKIRHNTSGDLWLDDFTRFAACGIGFHRIPRRMSTGHQIHPDWLVGTDLRVSHGCIRLPGPFAARVWDFGSIGTRVRVVRG
ncbi:L,D-transpeptidase family protein [Nocardioides sp. MH1]|uniref:L,D-transpeptidase family protein n=1 Tax=Nocardioides sp. MH1 TaxID=3242490 RepID=UPI00351FC217